MTTNPNLAIAGTASAAIYATMAATGRIIDGCRGSTGCAQQALRRKSNSVPFEFFRGGVNGHAGLLVLINFAQYDN